MRDKEKKSKEKKTGKKTKKIYREKEARHIHVLFVATTASH